MSLVIESSEEGAYLGSGELICKGLTLGCSPVTRTTDPSLASCQEIVRCVKYQKYLFQGHDMVL